jgi:hypothetical protein
MRATWAHLFVAIPVAAACSDAGGEAQTTETGGAASSGAAAVGGASGGVIAGGATGTGGVPANGGAPSPGGAPSTGGVPSTGGARGGATASGGTPSLAGAGSGGTATGGSNPQASGGSSLGGAGPGGGSAGVPGGGSAGTSAGGGGARALSFEADIWPVFALIREPIFEYYDGSTYESCVTAGVCHGGTSPGAGLRMPDPDTAYQQLFEVPSRTSLCDDTVRVVPGNPEQSCLILFYVQRLRNELEWVNDTEIDLVREWIAQGALP